MNQQDFVLIQSGKVVKNGNLLLSHEGPDFLKHAYRSLHIDYPKFHKMDVLAQLAFLGSEWLSELSAGYPNDAVAQLFCNSSSSLHADTRFQDSYADGNGASPSLFVYTLPNIASGEVSIRHRLYGESQFFILTEFDPDFYRARCRILFDAGYKAVLCAWLEVPANAENAVGLLFFVTPENIERIADQKNHLTA